MTCKWLSDAFSEICVNGECPACADFCQCVHYPEICRWAEELETTSSEPPQAAVHLPMNGKAERAGADDG